MPNKKSLSELLSETRRLILSGQFLSLFSKAVFHLKNVRKLSKRSKSLLAHGSSVLEQALRACREAGVRPHLNFGTLLGYRRNKGFIQGDDDLDFGLLASDRPDIPLLIKTMEKAGFRLKAEHHLEGPLAAIGDYCEITFVHQETGVSTDFYFYHAWNQEILYAGAAELIGHFHEGLLKFTPVEKNKIAGYALSYPGDLAGKFVPAPFLSSEILVPADTDAYLERLYGNWKIPQKNFYYKNVSAIVSSASSTGIELVRLPAPAETAS